MSVLAPEVDNTTVLVIASSAGIFRGPTPHWCIPVWKERCFSAVGKEEV